MKKLPYLTVCLFLLFSLFAYQLADAAAFRWIRVGKIMVGVVDNGDVSEGSIIKASNFYYFDDFDLKGERRGWILGLKDWTDENGVLWPVKAGGVGQTGPNDELEHVMAVPDEDGHTIRRYFRYQPPSITIDGFSMEELFPLHGDEVNPDKIPGTADVMIESWVNTALGITIHMREFGWSQTNHDDYTIQDWTFYNTGNVDLDDEIELPNQTLKDVYFLNIGSLSGSAGVRWISCYGESPLDSMRISYNYIARRQRDNYDSHGFRRTEKSGYLNHPIYMAMSVLHCDKSVDDHSDDPSQPRMTGYTRME